ncbi:MAG: RNA polymerase sigma factor [bacterium]|nr:RNA polymerase sigma factor [bacterium]
MQFEEVVTMYSDKLFNMAFGFTGNYDDASDITQEALFLAYKSFSKFRGDSNVYTWLYRIAKNECYKHFNKNKTSLLPLNAEMIKEAVPDVENKLRIQKLISTLPVEYREPIVLKYYNDMPYEEIANTIGVPIGTVRSRLARGKEMLEKKLNLRGGQPSLSD